MISATKQTMTRRLGEHPELLVFDTGQVLARAVEHGDLFAQVSSLGQQLPALGS